MTKEGGCSLCGEGEGNANTVRSNFWVGGIFLGRYAGVAESGGVGLKSEILTIFFLHFFGFGIDSAGGVLYNMGCFGGDGGF